MRDRKFTFTGGPALAVAVVIVGLFGYRALTFRNLENSGNLVKEVRMLLQTEYLPGDVGNMEKLYGSGDTEGLEKAVESLKTTRVSIESITAGIPPFNFDSGRRRVVTKVVYTITDSGGLRQEGTRYYSFEHYPVGDRWRGGYEVAALSYYLSLF